MNMNENTPLWKWEDVTTCQELKSCDVGDAISILQDIQERYKDKYAKLSLDIDIEECYGDTYVEVKVTGYRQETALEVEARVGKNKAAIEARRARLLEELHLLEGKLDD